MLLSGVIGMEDVTHGDAHYIGSVNVNPNSLNIPQK